MTKRIAIAIELDHAFPWHHDCYRGILEYGRQAGWKCVVDPYLVGMTGQSGIADYDGVVGRINSEVAEAARAHQIPVVNHWRNSPVTDLPSVLHDSLEGARLAAEHLVAGGYKRFAHLGIRNLNNTPAVLNELNRVYRSYSFPDASSIEFDFNFETSREGVIQMRRAMTDWLKRLNQPIGVYVQACHCARYLAQICAELGLSVPQDLGIVVHLGDNVLVSSASPTLSVVEVDFFNVGYESAALLDQLMQDETIDPFVKYIKPKRIIIRESSDVFISSDPMICEAIRYIAGHCRQTLGVEELAEHVKTSRRTLERRFEEVLNRSVYGEIKRLRTDHIRRLLLETDLSLASIAEDCGFSSVSHFTRYFRNEAGTTPGSFRKQAGARPDKG